MRKTFSMILAVAVLGLFGSASCEKAESPENAQASTPAPAQLAPQSSAPVTAAGSVTLNLAERIALSITRWVLYGRKELSLGSAIAGMDMRTTIRPYGRPETAVANLMTAQLARFYGASFSGQAGLTDAKLPSTEAGAQKAMTALPTLLCGGSVWIDAGLLSTDEVCSPVQMVLDAELVSALKRFTRELEITAESIGIDTVLAAGPGGQYLDVDHTASRVRDELWEPAIWSRTMLGQWMNSGGLTDVERARETVLRFMESEREERPAPDDAEREWAAVIRRAAADMLQ